MDVYVHLSISPCAEYGVCLGNLLDNCCFDPRENTTGTTRKAKWT